MRIGFALSTRDQHLAARRNRARWPWIVPAVVLGLGTLTQCSAAGVGSSVATTPPTATSSAAATTSSAAASPAQVTEVVDGDTVKVADPVRGAVTVRVLGIDTPETKKPGFTVGCFGPEASANATQLLAGQQVALTADPTQDATDRFGRTLAYLTLPDGRDYSVVAVRGGFAKSYVYNNAPVTKQTRDHRS